MIWTILYGSQLLIHFNVKEERSTLWAGSKMESLANVDGHGSRNTNESARSRYYDLLYWSMLHRLCLISILYLTSAKSKRIYHVEADCIDGELNRLDKNWTGSSTISHVGYTGWCCPDFSCSIENNSSLNFWIYFK